MKIPLFPLNMVLFPGQTLPLHIFEPRYKEMLKWCLSEQKPFGLVLIQDNGRYGRGTPHNVGTFARITQVEEMPEGRCSMAQGHRGNCFNISCVGEDRFRVNSLDRREAEYLVGEVEPFPDEPSPPPAMAMVSQRVIAMFDDYYRSIIALMGGWQRESEPGEPTLLFDVNALARGQAVIHEKPELQEGPHTIKVPALPRDPAIVSNVIAVELNVQPEVKQELLEMPSALARLQREAEILSEETPQMQERLRSQQRRRFRAFGSTN